MSGDAPPGLSAENLRKRIVPIQARSEVEARNAVLELNAREERTTKEEKDRKTFGRTPDGTGRTSRTIAVYNLDRAGFRRLHEPRYESPTAGCASWT
jgi:hypothetical protein